MKHVWKCLLAAVLMLAMLLSVTGAAEDTTYGVCTGDSVKVRKQPSTSANIWFYIDAGFVCEILDQVEDAQTRSRFARILQSPVAGSKDEMITMARDCVARIRHTAARRRYKELMERMKTCPPEEQLSLLQEAQALDAQLRMKSTGSLV